MPRNIPSFPALRAVPAPAVLLLLVLMALVASPAASEPSGNQSWSQEPWTGEEEAAEPIGETVLSSPLSVNLSEREPQTILAAGQSQNYSQFAASSAAAQNSLWIEKDGEWRKSLQTVVGESVDIIAITQKAGSNDLYLISYSNSSIKHYNFKFQAGYHLMRLVPGETGRLFLLMVSQGEPCGTLMLDVEARPSGASASAVDVSSISLGESLITIKSNKFRGYDVYVDGVFFCSDGSDGSLDGIASFTVSAGKTHTVTISQRNGLGGIINESKHTRVFERDTAYTLLIT